MEVINLHVLSADMDYALALGEGLSALTKNFIVKICGDERDMSGGGFDLALSDIDLTRGADGMKDDKRIIMMSDSRAGCFKDIENMEFVLYKYAGLRDIYSDMLLYYSILTGKRHFSWTCSDSRIIVFCSGMGGAGKTTVSFAAAQALRRYCSKSALYLSLEEIESTLLYMEGKEGFGLCEYLYYLFKRGGRKPDMGAFMVYDKFGTAAFMPDKGYNKLRELKADELAAFFKEISESGAYDYILVDAGECLNAEMRWIFNACHRAVVILSPASGEREKRFLNYIRFIVGDEAESRTVIVHNKAVFAEEAPEGDESVHIEFDASSIVESGGLIEVSIDQDLGAGIKGLIKKIV